MVYSAHFNCVFDAQNLLLNTFYTYIAEIQLPGNGIRLFSVIQSSGWISAIGWPLVISITSWELQMLYASSLC
jgi:hypothetical protein